MTPRAKLPVTLADRVRAGSAHRRSEQKLGLREQILAAATQLLDEEGYDGFSLRRLAARIGYSATTVYRHFDDKDALVLAVMDLGFERFGRRLHEAAATSADPFAQIRAIGRAYVEFGFEEPLLYRVMFLQRCDMWEGLSEDKKASHMSGYDLLVRTVESAIATGRTTAGNAGAISGALWAQVHGVVTLGLTMPFLDPPAIRAMTDAALDLQSRGLLARDTRDTRHPE